MAKSDFCFTYYDGDATRDMAHMNRLQRGAYTDLVISQRKFGPLKIDQIKMVLGKDFEECWPAIELVMKKDGEFFALEWLSNSEALMKKSSRHQSENGKKGGRGNKSEKKESEIKPNESQMYVEIKPLEDEDVIKNGNDIEFKEKNESENFELWAAAVIDESDFIFYQLFHGENAGRSVDIIISPDLVKAHEKSCIEKGTVFTKQQHYRKSLIGYLKTVTDRKKTETPTNTSKFEHGYNTGEEAKKMME